MKKRKFKPRSHIPIFLMVAMLSLFGAHGAGAQPATEQPEPGPIPAGEVRQTVTFSSPDNSAEVADKIRELRSSNPLARVEPYECYDDRFNSCDAFVASVVQESQQPGGPVIQWGRWDVYITLMMRVQARQPTGVMFVDTEVVKVLPDSVAGTLTLNLRQFPPGVTAGNQIGSWQIPVAEGQPGFNEQVDIDSPYAGYYQEVSDFATDWVLDTPVPGMAQSTGTQYTDIVLRCDNAVGAFPGCVNPDYTPTLTFTGLSYINMNIGNHQSNTGVGATWGTPLHRGESPLAAVANRDAACNTNRDEALGEPPDGMVDPSCDEYPFASSVEGGGAASVLWVPLAENLSQGGQTSTFYQNNRVMPGDAFFVDYT